VKVWSEGEGVSGLRRWRGWGKEVVGDSSALAVKSRAGFAFSYYQSNGAWFLPGVKSSIS
jgi:hypothetical protein